MTINVTDTRTGRLRSTLDIARDFIESISAGEWAPEVIEDDAETLADLLDKYKAALQPEPAIGSLGDKLDKLHADAIQLLATISDVKYLERRRTGSGLRPETSFGGPCGEIVLPISGTMGFGA